MLKLFFRSPNPFDLLRDISYHLNIGFQISSQNRIFTIYIFFSMSEGGDTEAKRELSTAERWLGVEKSKLSSRTLNLGYNLFVYPAVWFREKVIYGNQFPIYFKNSCES